MGYASPFRRTTSSDGVVVPSGTVGGLCPKSTTTTLDTVTGKGIFLYAFFIVNAANDSHELKFKMKIDGNLIYPVMNPHSLEGRGFGNASTPYQQYIYAADGFCMFRFYMENGIPFEDSVVFQAQETKGVTDQYGFVEYLVLERK